MRAFSWALARKYLLSRWVNLLGIGGVALAVWALILVIAVFSGFVGSIQQDIRRSSPDLLLTALPHDTGYGPLATALRDPDVAALAPRLRHYGVYYLRGGLQPLARAELADFRNTDTQFVVLLGIDPDLEGQVVDLRQWVERSPEGLRPPDPDRPLRVPDDLEYRGRQRLGLPVPHSVADYRAALPGLLLSKSRAQLLFRFEPGDPVDVVTAGFDPVAGGGDGRQVKALHKRFCVTGTFDTNHRLFDDNTALVPIEALRTMLGHDLADADSIDLCTDVAIALRPGADPLAVAARLREAARQVLPPGSAPEVLTWQQQNQVFLDAVEHERALMKLVLFAVMMVAAFLIHATLHMMVSTKVKDIGIVLAMGGEPRAVGAIFVLSAGVVAVLGCGIGLTAGIFSTIYLNPVNDWMLQTFGLEIFPRTLYDLPEVPWRLEPDWIAMVLGGALLLSLLAAWRPARQAARLQPVEALACE